VTDIFLSYNREDQARAKLFAEAFEVQGFKVWWDVGLRTGEAYDEVTETALRTAKAVVVLWSKKSVQSRWVRAEATLADRNKTLVPCMIEPCERPIMFELTQTAELAHWQGAGDDRVWVSFLSDVKRFIEDRGGVPVARQAKASLAEIIAEPPPPRETLLAVLPFDNLSSDAEMEFFSDGVSEDILGRITRGSKLKVIGRTSSFRFRGEAKFDAATALNATHVLDGSIRRAGTKVRISAHLTETETQTTLWADKYDRSLEDIFAVQDEISEAIADSLNTAFFPRKTAAIDPAIYDLYLRALKRSTDPAVLKRNIETLETVTRLAPTFADGWGRLAHFRAENMYQLPFAERPPIVERVQKEIACCTAIDKDTVFASLVQSVLSSPFGDFIAQEKSAQTMQERGLNSAESNALLAFFLECCGNGQEAAVRARIARDLDPQNELANTVYSQGLWRAGRFAEGRASMESMMQKWPDNHHTAAVLIMACAHQQDWDAVDALLDPERLAQFPLREHRGLAMLMPVLRNPDLAQKKVAAEFFCARLVQIGSIDANALIWPALMGHADMAYETLDKVKIGPSGGRGDVMGTNAYRPHVMFAAANEDLHADTRFVKLCARLGLVEYWLATQKWPDCAATVPYDFAAECEKYRDYPKDVFFG
jgi:TolB-like protein